MEKLKKDVKNSPGNYASHTRYKEWNVIEPSYFTSYKYSLCNLKNKTYLLSIKKSGKQMPTCST